MPQTLAQIEYLRQQGTAVFTIQPATLFNETERQTAVDRLAADICQRLLAGRHVVFHAPHLPAQVAHTRQLGAEQGLGKTAVAQLVSQTVADVAGLVVEGAGQNRLVVAGGETSAAVCTRLGVTGLQIWREIQPGLPSCLTLASPPLFLVLKSGSFGTPAFLADAIVHLQQQKEKP